MKRRKDSFFGLHFDFHASPEGCPRPIGETLSEDDIREICRLLRPDFLQIDCKGHPGYASYPTACGNAMPAFSGDPLEKWRRVTREEGVALYLHYSGVVDKRFCVEHPKQCVMAADGTRKPWATRTIGSYADDLLIPQLNEICEKYGADGVWVDGECWGTEADFDPDTVKAFERETGVSLNGKLPVQRDDPYFDEYRDFCRELFRRYLRHYVDAVHEKHPEFQIASNWAFTDHMPEKVCANVDFISGDLNPLYSFESARYAGRAIAQQGMTWDLMSWNFRSHAEKYLGHIVKHPVQIMQEAAAVIALGGGFQNYITQLRNGSPRMEQIRAMKPVADFMRAREPYCFRGKAAHQAALVLSTHDRALESASLFSRNGYEKIMGMTSLLCDAGHSLEIVSEHIFSGHEADYPVIVVPELYKELSAETAKSLLRYAREGGSLLLCGPTTCAFFEKAGLPVKTARSGEKTRLFSMDKQFLGRVFETSAVYAENAETLAWTGASPEAMNDPLAVVMSFGKGKVGLIGADLGAAYSKAAQYLYADMVNAVLRRLYEPMVTVKQADGTLEIVDLMKNGQLMIQLVNANGNHKNIDVATEKSIPACRDIVLSVSLPEKPNAVYLQPENQPLDFQWENGKAIIRVDRVNLHEIVEIR